MLLTTEHVHRCFPGSGKLREQLRVGAGIEMGVAVQNEITAPYMPFVYSHFLLITV